MQLNLWALTGLAVVVVVTYYLGQRTSRHSGNTADFLLARRTVRSRRNAAAIAGGYISAASFLGVAGLVLKQGADALWFPIGLTAGFLMLMIFVAAPMRRSGAHTLPDFLEERLDSVEVRRGAVFVVVMIGIVYLLPQLQGAGLVLSAIIPAPAWIGSVAVAIAITVNVLSGGLRAFTLVQAFQYWLKLFAFAVPAFILCAVFLGNAGAGLIGTLGGQTPPVLAEDTTVALENDVVLQVSEPTPVRIVEGTPGTTWWVPGTTYPVDAGTTVVFPAGAKVPVVEDAALDNASWLRPTEDSSDLWWTYSVIVATFFGTMGLPHVLMRFYTNPDGKAARRSAVHVVLLLGLFYLFPVLIGVLSRLHAPKLLMTGRTDAAVLEVPLAMLPGVSGQILAAVLAAGAFAALLSASSGLLNSVGGIVATDLLGGRGRDFRMATIVVALIPAMLAILLPIGDLALSVGLAFALAASTCCPLLILGIWWRRFTWPGAMAGMCVGGGLVGTAIVLNLVSNYTGGWAPWFINQPALFTVPAAFLVTVVVSLATARSAPEDVNAVMLRMHAPDPLGFAGDQEQASARGTPERRGTRRGRHRK